MRTHRLFKSTTLHVHVEEVHAYSGAPMARKVTVDIDDPDKSC